MIRTRCVLAGALSLVGLDAAAHHSTAAFDLNREITLDGVVVDYEWKNPHVYVDVQTKNDDGESVVWAIEAQPAAGMTRAGWSADSLAAGDHVIVVANPSKRSTRLIALGQQSVLKEDGTRLTVPQSNGRVPSGDAPAHKADSLSGRWVTRWNADVALRFLRASDAWSLTPRAVAAVNSYGPSDNPGNDCVPEPVPYRMIWPVPIDIDVGREVAMIRFETAGEERTIHMNMESHDGAPYAVFGHSIGSWDGDALVVDTAHFAEHRRGNSVGGLASGRQKRLLERFELSADRTYLSSSFILEDPEYLAEPVEGTLELAYRPDFEFAALACNLETARRYLEQ